MHFLKTLCKKDSICVSYSRTYCSGINQQQAGVWEGDKFYTVFCIASSEPHFLGWNVNVCEKL